MAGGDRTAAGHGTLSVVLQDIYAAGIPQVEQRMLARHAVSIRLQMPGAQEPALKPLEAMEDALQAIQLAAGLPGKPSIGSAKDLLRQVGHPSLAARLGRLSKLRNGHAHADAGLVRELRLLQPMMDKRAATCSGSTVSDPGTVSEDAHVPYGLKLDQRSDDVDEEAVHLADLPPQQ